MAVTSSISKLSSHSLLIDSSKNLDEWNIEGIEILDPREPKKPCICKERSRYICHILNYSTNKQVQLSLECVEKFNEDDQISKSLKQLRRIFSGCTTLLIKPSITTTKELVEYALQEKVITNKNASFYHKCIDRTSFTEEQKKYKERLNQVLIAMISSAKFAYNRLLDEKTNIAAPRLIYYAFEKGVLTKDEKRKYLELWNRMNIPSTKRHSISFMQKEELININKKILTELKPYLEKQSITNFFPLASSSSSSGSSSEDSLVGKRKRE